jgi:hypothetical protein
MAIDERDFKGIRSRLAELGDTLGELRRHL